MSALLRSSSNTHMNANCEKLRKTIFVRVFRHFRRSSKTDKSHKCTYLPIPSMTESSSSSTRQPLFEANKPCTIPKRSISNLTLFWRRQLRRKKKRTQKKSRSDDTVIDGLTVHFDRKMQWYRCEYVRWASMAVIRHCNTILYFWVYCAYTVHWYVSDQ